ncbi:ATP-binding cassette sub-family G member 2 [Stegastes partitus]|uniref:Broad substrate specificity ATP-binding cassette transporter ABCG2 n=1 Tax=Stegastes partitus TaxID=144197 RepID=A0A9Y4NA76_9TELE|nr:PREDICTED: ATP-binding cassette sub-family G member 2 [Stegastes partitus]
MAESCRINFGMDEISTNGLDNSSLTPAVDLGERPRGSIVSFHNINYTVKIKSGPCWKRAVNEKNILVDLNGIMKPGLNAILGPTGSGKSSFLDILAARKDSTGLSGDVLIDGAPQLPNFKSLSGYVVQDDVVLGTLTVRENLRFSAALRLPSSVPQSEKEARVNELIRDLGLTRVADSKVGTPLSRGISGGERKRTSIGMELIINPAVLFLDEPTTGLDASTANTVLQLLKRMSDNGKTIIFSIHQPRYSIYKLFDTLTLLVNGKLVYHGSAPDALEYFISSGFSHEAKNNPADFFLDVINGQNGVSQDLSIEELDSPNRHIEESLVEKYKQSQCFRSMQTEQDRIFRNKRLTSRPVFHTVTYNSSFLNQLRWVLRRTFKNVMLTQQISVVQLAVNFILALVVGAIFFKVKDDQSGLQNRMGALFFITTNKCFSVVSAAELFITERKLFVHEYISGYYRVSVYFIAKILVDFALRVATTLIFCVIIYFLIMFKTTAEAFFIFTLTVNLLTCTATTMATAIAAGQSSVSTATVIITITFVFMMIFSGLLVNLPSIASWLSWLKYFSIPRYALAALQINEFVGLKICEDSVIQNRNMSAEMSNCTMTRIGDVCTGEQYLMYLGIEPTVWGLWKNHVALTVIATICLAIGYLKLRYMKKFT